MIFDFILDCNHVAELMNSDDNSVAYLKRFYQILTYENGRLIVPTELKEDKLVVLEAYYNTLKSLYKSLGGMNMQTPLTLQKKDLCERFLKAFGAASVSVDTISLRKLKMPELKNTGVSFIQQFCKKNFTPKAQVVLTADETCEGECETLEKYFEIDNEKERKRFSYMMMQTVECKKGSKKKPYDLGVVKNREKEEKFSEQMQAFGAAEDRNFWIFDPYILSDRTINCQIEGKMKILLAWLKTLLNENTKPTIHLFSSYPDEAKGMLEKQDEFETRLRDEYLNGSSEVYTKLRSMCKLEVYFPKFLDDKSFHDRFICSSTHYFAVGRGLDAIRVSERYNVYYCGKFLERLKMPSLPIGLSSVNSSSKSLFPINFPAILRELTQGNGEKEKWKRIVLY